jgi:short-subunit dehydrogenase
MGVELRGAIVVVTGASSGIGWSAAGAFAREGATVVASARRAERLALLVAEIERRGGRARAVRCDVTSWDDVAALRDRVLDDLGRCDVLVANAGIPGGGRFEDTTVERLETLVRTNLLGVLYAAKAFLPAMLDAGRGHIVNVASLAGRYATPGSATYSATKHAVVAFSEALHGEVARQGVLVTAVNPGLVQTEGFRQPKALERVGLVMQPGRVAEALVHVVRSDIAPEYSVPRWQAAFQATRVLTPGLYRRGMTMLTDAFGARPKGGATAPLRGRGRGPGRSSRGGAG